MSLIAWISIIYLAVAFLGYGCWMHYQMAKALLEDPTFERDVDGF